MLTDKCKVDFEKWIEGQSAKPFLTIPTGYENCDIYLDDYFKELPESMQYGVYVDFFDSVEVFIDSINVNQNKSAFVCGVNGVQLGYFETRPEARTKAIGKANELYNKL